MSASRFALIATSLQLHAAYSSHRRLPRRRSSERQSGEVVTDEYSLALLTRNELLATYRAAHLRLAHEYGSYDLTPLEDDSSMLIHVLALDLACPLPETEPHARFLAIDDADAPP